MTISPTVAFTGHRPNKFGAYYWHDPKLRWVIWSIEDALIHFRPMRVISGMALGVDTWATQIALKMGIPVTAAIPCDEQDKLWHMTDKLLYRLLLDKCDKVINVNPGPYTSWKMQARNQYMVDRCNQLIAIWDGSSGGTGNCVKYAQKVDKPIYFIRP